MTSTLYHTQQFCPLGIHPFDTVQWSSRDAEIKNHAGEGYIFKQDGVEFPVFYSDQAVQIIAQKYFRGHLGSPEREWSLKQVISRIAGTIADWGEKNGYFDKDGKTVFFNDLAYLMVNQYMAFNSPVWFNIGVPGRDPQASACFILDVQDDFQSIMDWYRDETFVFKGGSGAGVNLSKIRSSKEKVSTGGVASGPVSFMRAADANAGTIKSGGSTRRAAKMVILNVDHPDIREFVWCKAEEERKIRALKDAGFDMSLSGKDIFSVQFQNANNSVRVPDAFMEAVVNDAMWDLKSVTDGSIIETVPAKELWAEIAQAAWECADPGLQFESTITDWNTTPKYELHASNPCSEHIRRNQSSCNLASVNLTKFLTADGSFDFKQYAAVCALVLIAQDILICESTSPTPQIREVTLYDRDLGMGVMGLGATLLRLGVPYDSEDGRNLAAALQGILTASGYCSSAAMAARVGMAPVFAEEDGVNLEGVKNIVKKHLAAATKLKAGVASSTEDLSATGLLIKEATKVNWLLWKQARQDVGLSGARNAQISVAAPTGTISFACDSFESTGIEPLFSLVTYKSLAGGGSMVLPSKSVSVALENLGYSREEAVSIEKYIKTHNSVVGSGIRVEHIPIFATAVSSNNAIDPMGHVKMLAALQPFVSGALSKTVNVPQECTVEEFSDVYLQAWKMGVKCIAVYRDGCKAYQPLDTSKDTQKEQPAPEKFKFPTPRPGQSPAAYYAEHFGTTPPEFSMPGTALARAVRFKVGGQKVFLHLGQYRDGTLSEVFITLGKNGSTLGGFAKVLSLALSKGIQRGIPLEEVVNILVDHRFEPAGIVEGHENLKFASSIPDAIGRVIGYLYGGKTEMVQVPDLPPPPDEDIDDFEYLDEIPLDIFDNGDPDGVLTYTGDICSSCGSSKMVKAGACAVCQDCGSSSGCS